MQANRNLARSDTDVTAIMELQRERPPPYQSHNPDNLALPSVPNSDLAGYRSPSSDITLPDLRSALGDLPTKTVQPNVLLSAAAVQQASRPPYDSSLQGGDRTLPLPDISPRSVAGRSSIESIISPSDTASVMSIEEQSQRSTSVSLEDPDVRLAAEALSGLGKSGKRMQQATLVLLLIGLQVMGVRQTLIRQRLLLITVQQRLNKAHNMSRFYVYCLAGIRG